MRPRAHRVPRLLGSRARLGSPVRKLDRNQWGLIDSWNGSGTSSRYFVAANQLPSAEVVVMMIFQALTVQESPLVMPWAIKEM